MSLEDINILSLHGVTEAITHATLKINEHCVAVPFFLYWLFSNAVNFDNRFWISLTVFSYLVQLIMIRGLIVTSWRWCLPVALIVFSPAHFMDLLWGFEFTLSLSVVFPVLGLCVIESMGAGKPSLRKIMRFLIGLGLLLLGALSSAGGFFGFVAALFLVLVGGLEKKEKLFYLLLLSVLTAVIFIAMLYNPEQKLSLGGVLLPKCFAAFGGAILGTPVGLTAFSFDFLAISGSLVCLLMLVILFRARKTGLISKIALPTSFFVFSSLSILSIAIGRKYLGNWHLSYAVIGVCGMFGAAFRLRQYDSSSCSSKRLLWAALALLLLTIPAYFSGFRERGPAYNEYIRQVENYMVHYLDSPMMDKPFPITGGWDFNEDMALFLIARNHALFASANNKSLTEILGNKKLIKDARLFVNGISSEKLSSDGQKHLRVTIMPEKELHVGSLVLQVDQSLFLLSRIHHSISGISDCDVRSCYSGWILSGALPPGSHSFLVFRKE